MKFKISESLSLPKEVVTEKLAFLGRTGSGKTYAAQKLAEQMHKYGVQFVVLDPVGVWLGLRLAADGKKPGLPIPVLGGLHGDIPLESGAGALVANLIVDSGSSMVLDVSQFESDAEKARFAKAFADRFFFRKKASPSAVHVFIEEAQEFVPQNPQRDEGQMLHAFTRMVKIGRNFGIGVSLISQRPQEVNKKVLNQTELLFCFQLTGPQERKTIQGWIAEKGIDEDIASELPKLERGEPHVWSPAWLKISKRVLISEKETFDASSTPKLGGKADTRTLSPIDLQAFQHEMAATIERAKQEDPKLLRQRIAQLERQLRDRLLPDATRVQKVKVPVVTDGQVKRFEATVCRVEKLQDKTLKALAQVAELGTKMMADLHKVANPILSVSSGTLFSGNRVPDVRLLPRPWIPNIPIDGKSLPQGERAVLTAVAQHDAVSREQVTILTGYKTSTRNAYIQRLREKGLVEFQGQDILVTAAGELTLGDDFEKLPTGGALRAYWLQKLPEGERRIFAVLTERYPKGVSREDLSELTGYKTSTRNAYIQRLSTRKLVQLSGSQVIASPGLF